MGGVEDALKKGETVVNMWTANPGFHFMKLVAKERKDQSIIQREVFKISSQKGCETWLTADVRSLPWIPLIPREVSLVLCYEPGVGRDKG